MSQIRRYPILTIVCIIIVAIALVFGYRQYTAAQKPTPRGIQCGTLSLRGSVNGYTTYDVNGKRDTVPAIGDCFWNAYQQSHTATLTVSRMGTDTGSSSMFIVDQQQGKRVLTDTVEGYNINSGKSYTTTYTCTALTRNGNVLHFANCGEDGDVVFSL